MYKCDLLQLNRLRYCSHTVGDGLLYCKRPHVALLIVLWGQPHYEEEKIQHLRLISAPQPHPSTPKCKHTPVLLAVSFPLSPCRSLCVCSSVRLPPTDVFCVSQQQVSCAWRRHVVNHIAHIKIVTNKNGSSLNDIAPNRCISKPSTTA